MAVSVGGTSWFPRQREGVMIPGMSRTTAPPNALPTIGSISGCLRLRVVNAGTGRIDGSPGTVKQPVAPWPPRGWPQQFRGLKWDGPQRLLQTSTGTVTP